jgi:hypothetical protein
MVLPLERPSVDNALTLIRAAGGVYDFRNFKQVYLRNVLSSNFEN